MNDETKNTNRQTSSRQIAETRLHAQMDEEDILQQAKAIVRKRFQRSHFLTSPDATRDFLTMTLATEPKEIFGLILLDTQHCVLGFESLFTGTIDGASVYPREIVKCVLDANAAAVILAHNHPSGHREPSQADRTITQKIKQALNTVEVRVLDHLLVAGPAIISFAELGLL